MDIQRSNRVIVRGVMQLKTIITVGFYILLVH